MICEFHKITITTTKDDPVSGTLLAIDVPLSGN